MRRSRISSHLGVTRAHPMKPKIPWLLSRRRASADVGPAELLEGAELAELADGLALPAAFEGGDRHELERLERAGVGPGHVLGDPVDLELVVSPWGGAHVPEARREVDGEGDQIGPKRGQGATAQASSRPR